jgi:excisionase family DNA binding protein
MEETPIVLPVKPSEFYQNIKVLIEKAIDEKINGKINLPDELADKTLLLPNEVCRLLRISKPTLYELIKPGTLTGFKIQSRRYFARTDVERLMRKQIA